MRTCVMFYDYRGCSQAPSGFRLYILCSARQVELVNKGEQQAHNQTRYPDWNTTSLPSCQSGMMPRPAYPVTLPTGRSTISLGLMISSRPPIPTPLMPPILPVHMRPNMSFLPTCSTIILIVTTMTYYSRAIITYVAPVFWLLWL